MFASVQAGLMVDVAPSPAVSDIAPAVSVAAFSDLPHALTASTAAVSSITLKPGVFDNIESPDLETARAGAVVVGWVKWQEMSQQSPLAYNLRAGVAGLILVVLKTLSWLNLLKLLFTSSARERNRSAAFAET